MEDIASPHRHLALALARNLTTLLELRENLLRVTLDAPKRRSVSNMRVSG